jgi:hypothetical protein
LERRLYHLPFSRNKLLPVWAYRGGSPFLPAGFLAFAKFGSFIISTGNIREKDFNVVRTHSPEDTTCTQRYRWDHVIWHFSYVNARSQEFINCWTSHSHNFSFRTSTFIEHFKPERNPLKTARVMSPLMFGCACGL